MAAAFSLHTAQERHAQQRQVANDVQNLVAHELIGKTQTGLIQHAMLRQYNRIVQRTATDQVRTPQGFDFFDEAKSSSRSDVARE